MRRMYPTSGVGLLALLCALPLSSVSAAAQTAPPIQGVTGTIATDGTIDSEHATGRVIAEGAAQVVRSAKKLFSFGGRGTGQNPLEAFGEGRRVVVRDVAGGAREDLSNATEGVVVDVNRRRQQITIRFADRKTQTLRLVAPPGAADVVVSLAGQARANAAYDFKRVS